MIGVDPSALMRETARRRCAELISKGRVRVESGVAEDTGLPDAAVDVVLTVNNVPLWPDWPAGFAEVHRVLRPGGRLLLSVHQKWLPGGQAALTTAVDETGFSEVRRGPGNRRTRAQRPLCNCVRTARQINQVAHERKPAV